MATITKVEWTTEKGKTSNRWKVEYRDSVNKRRFKNFKKQKDAKSFAAQIASDVNRGVHVADSQTMTFGEFHETYLRYCDAQGLERSTWKDYEGVLRNYLVPRFGKQRLTEITIKNVKDFLLELRVNSSLSHKRIMRIKIILGAVLSLAIEDEYLSRNVVKFIKLRAPKEKVAIHVDDEDVLDGVLIPTLEDLAKIIGVGNLSLRDHCMIVMAVMTGLRASELFGLGWRHIDFTKSIVMVRRRVDIWRQMGSLKTKASKRNVPIPSLAIELLKSWKSQCPDTEEGLCFPNEVGKSLNRPNWDKRVWTQHLKSLDLLVKGKKKYLYKNMRHAFASLAIKEGANPKEIMKMMGHSKISITFGIYGDLFPDDENFNNISEKIAQSLKCLSQGDSS
ncbi:MAG: site-specific integrase [Emcibacter sp.]|nr:site-specific integrase [Emcibacter sp.]